MAAKQTQLDAAAVAKHAINSLGKGYDITCDLRFSACKDANGGPLIEINSREKRELVFPGGPVIHNVPAVFKCDKGERTRFRSEILTFDQMSQEFNQGLSLTGKTPSGLFNSMFQFTGVWPKDAASTKRLVLDGWFYTLYTVEMPRSNLVLKNEIKASVPSSWDSAALASFIESYGTHIIVGLRIGGKDVVYLKQQQSSSLTPDEVQKRLSEVSDERFSQTERPFSKHDQWNRNYDMEFNRQARMNLFDQAIYNNKQQISILPKRKGGHDNAETHSEWIRTVPLAPDVISMSFVPITSLLNGVLGSGFLSHAVNLYLKYKPPIEELRQFLEFQLPRQWAPVFGELPLTLSRKERSPLTLKFSLLGPKLKVSNTQVTVGKTPVTGMRLYLEGKKCDKLAIHLQHLAAIPKMLQPLWEEHPFASQSVWQGPEDFTQKYFEPIQWKSFSHVCTAPVENTDTLIGDHAGASVVVGAQLGVQSFGITNVLYLKLMYSKIPEARIRRSEWDHMPSSTQKSGVFSSFLSTTFSSPAPPKPPPPVVLNSGVFPEGPPRPIPDSKLLKYVDMTEMTKGAQDMPGHWLVTGAKLYLDNKKISMRVKYSLLTIYSD